MLPWLTAAVYVRPDQARKQSPAEHAKENIDEVAVMELSQGTGNPDIIKHLTDIDKTQGRMRFRIIYSMKTIATNLIFTLVFRDYKQTQDNGHNTISVGVCKGDGTIHVAMGSV